MTLTMLTDEVEAGEAVGIWPQPSFAAVVAGAVLVAPRKVPEGDCDVIAIQPLPVVAVALVADGAHPVLAAAVASAISQI